MTLCCVYKTVDVLNYRERLLHIIFIVLHLQFKLSFTDVKKITAVQLHVFTL